VGLPLSLLAQSIQMHSRMSTTTMSTIAAAAPSTSTHSHQRRRMTTTTRRRRPCICFKHKSALAIISLLSCYVTSTSSSSLLFLLSLSFCNGFRLETIPKVLSPSQRRNNFRHPKQRMNAPISFASPLSYQPRQQLALRQQGQGRQSATRTTFLTVLFMGKGDGKKKRKKSSSSASSAVSPQSQDAPRVSTNINIPVRKQIAWANLNKQYRAQQQAGSSFRQTANKNKVVRTKYRRTWDEAEIERKAEERRRKGQDPDWSVILNRTSAAPLLIVDGYNIIHRWGRLKKHMTKGDPSHARQLLVDDLENLASLKRWRIECVFDGTRRSTVGPLGHGPRMSSRSSSSSTSTTSRPQVSKHGVRVVYTSVGVEADSYIESRCAVAKNVTEGAITGSLIVATDDTMIRLAGQNAGALCMSADRFVQELKAVRGAIAHRVEAAVAKANGHSIRPETLRGRNSIMQGRFKNSAVIIRKKTEKSGQGQTASTSGREEQD